MGGEGGLERAWWQTFVYVFLLVHHFKGQRAYPVEVPRRLETHCSVFRMLMHPASSRFCGVQRRDVMDLLRRNNNI